MDLIAQLLLENRTGAYIEWLANELIMTANKTHTKGFTTSNVFRKQKGNPANHKAYHILWSQKIILISWISLASTLCTKGLFTPIAGAA